MKNIDIIYLAIISIKFMILSTMLHSDALIGVEPKNIQKCLLCNKIISEQSRKQVVTQKAWYRLINDAKKWSEVNIDSNHDLYEFKNVNQKVLDKELFCNVSYLFVHQQSIKVSTNMLLENSCATSCAKDFWKILVKAFSFSMKHTSTLLNVFRMNFSHKCTLSFLEKTFTQTCSFPHLVQYFNALLVGSQ